MQLARSKFNSFAATMFALMLAMFASPAFATGPAPVDVSSVTAAIEAALVPIGLIGLAVLALLVGIKTYKWIRRAM